MASGAIYSAIQEYVRDSWTATPIYFENELLLTDGSSVPPDPAVTPAWIVVEITGTSYAQQSLGIAPQANNRWDEEGVLLLSVMVPSGSGSAHGRFLAKELADIFRGVRLMSDSLEFRDATLGRGSPSEANGNWFELPVDIQWRRIDAPPGDA